MALSPSPSPSSTSHSLHRPPSASSPRHMSLDHPSTPPVTLPSPLPHSLTPSLPASSLFYWLWAMQVMLPSTYFITCEEKRGSTLRQASMQACVRERERARRHAFVRQSARSSSAEMGANNNNKNNKAGGVLFSRTALWRRPTCGHGCLMKIQTDSGPPRRCPVQ